MCDLSKRKLKRSFSNAWLNDDRIKHWIRTVSFNESLYHCIICNKNISCNTHVLRHADSACHKNNIKENTPSLLNIDNKNSNKEISATININLKKKFREQWLDVELFKPWLRKASHIFFVHFVINLWLVVYRKFIVTQNPKRI